MAQPLRVGQALYSTIDPTSVIVIKAPTDPASISVNGVEMTVSKPDTISSDTPSGEGTLLGKRYADDVTGIELLVTKPGTATLEVNGERLAVKESKPLPSSD